MTRKRGTPYVVGQSIIFAVILILLYSYFYYAYYGAGIYYTSPFSVQAWVSSLLLSLLTVMAGMLIELSRFWGWVVQYRFKQELLIVQGIPSGLLGLVPDTFWTYFFGNHYPFNFLADQAVSGAAGVWFGVILLRSFLEQKKIKEEEESSSADGKD